MNKQHISKAGKELLQAKGVKLDTEAVISALDVLCDALGIGRSESSTEKLFFVLAEAFNPAEVERMMVILQESHDKGLCYDMRGPIAQGILNALVADSF